MQNGYSLLTRAEAELPYAEKFTIQDVSKKLFDV